MIKPLMDGFYLSGGDGRRAVDRRPVETLINKKPSQACSDPLVVDQDYKSERWQVPLSFEL